MNFTDVLISLRSGRWWMEEAPGATQLFHYIMQCFVSHNILGRTTLQKTAYVQMKNGMTFEITPADEKEDIFEEVLQKEIQSPGWFAKHVTRWHDIKKEQDALNKKVVAGLSTLSDTELLDLYKALHHVNKDFVMYGTFIECLDPYSEKLPQHFREKYNLTDAQTRKYLSLLSTPIERSFLTQEKIDFLHVCLGKMSIELFHEKYYWFETNYKDAQELTKEEIKRRVEALCKAKSKEEMKNEIQRTEELEKEQIMRKEKVLQQIKMTPEDTALFDLIALFAHLMDFRKENMMKTTYSRYHLIAEIAKRKKVDIELLLRMTAEECFSFFEGKKVDLDHINNRTKGIVFYFTPTEEIEFQGEQAEKLYDAYMGNLLQHEFKGQIAFDPGHTVQGTVCKVLNTKTEQFTEGHILVTSMTRPDFMHMMRKAKAVITDEGGITCHAAIVSRELQLPCVIGTKVATKKLESGDVIEINFTTGMIKILEKHHG